MSETLLIGTIPKAGGEVRLQLGSYKGHQFLQIQFFYEDESGELQPTKKSVTIPISEVDHFKELVASIEVPKGFVTPDVDPEEDKNA